MVRLHMVFASDNKNVQADDPLPIDVKPVEESQT